MRGPGSRHFLEKSGGEISPWNPAAEDNSASGHMAPVAPVHLVAQYP